MVCFSVDFVEGSSTDTTAYYGFLFGWQKLMQFLVYDLLHSPHSKGSRIVQLHIPSHTFTLFGFNGASQRSTRGTCDRATGASGCGQELVGHCFSGFAVGKFHFSSGRCSPRSDFGSDFSPCPVVWKTDGGRVYFYLILQGLGMATVMQRYWQMWFASSEILERWLGCTFSKRFPFSNLTVHIICLLFFFHVQMPQAPTPPGECLPGRPEFGAATHRKRSAKPPAVDGRMFWQTLLEATLGGLWISD